MEEIIKKDLTIDVIIPIRYDVIFSSQYDDDISELKELLISRKYTTDYLNTALFRACERGNIEVVKLLLESGANDLEKALLHSIKHPTIVKYLLDKGAKINIITKIYSHTKWLEAGLDPIFGDRFGTLKPVAVYKDISLLELAVSSGNLESIRYIVGSSQDIFGFSEALQMAVDKNNIEIVSVLIDVDMTVDYKYLLVSACQNKNIDMLKLLIKSGANIMENLSTIYRAYYYLPSSNEKELDSIFFNAGVSPEIIREIKTGTHKSIPNIFKELMKDNIHTINNNNLNVLLEKKQIDISDEQQKYNQNIIDVIEAERKEQIDRIVASNSEKTSWDSVRAVISIFGVIPLDALEKSSGETKNFILKLMLIVKNYFGDTDLYYEKYIKTNKDWFEYWKNAFVWFRRCQTLDKTLISNPEEPIKYPPISISKVLTKKLTPPKTN